MTFRKKIFSILTLGVILLGVFGVLFKGTKSAQATEITTFTVTGATLTSNGQVSSGETMSLDVTLSLPNEQTISSGDTIDLQLPAELAFPTSLTNQLVTVAGKAVGSYTTSASDSTIRITFSDEGETYFKENSLDKGLNIGLNVIASKQVQDENPTAATISFEYPVSNELSYDYAGSGDGAIDNYTFKYGFVSSSDPTLINWFVVVDSSQDIIRNLVIQDTLGSGQTLTGNVRLVQLAYKSGGYASEAEARAGSVTNNLSSYVTYTDASGQTLSSGEGAQSFSFVFDQMRGDSSPYNNVYGGGSSPEYSPAYIIQYSTRITDTSAVTGTLSNQLTISGSNIPDRSITKTVSYDFSSWGIAWGNKSTSAVIEAQKQVQDTSGQTVDLEDGQFEFALYQVDSSGNETLVSTTRNTADGSIQFDPITYQKAGLYSYIVREIAGTDEDYTYSDQSLKYFVNVTLEDDQYVASVGSPTSGTTITNTYNPQTTTEESTTSTTEESTTTTTTEDPTTTSTTEEPTTTSTTEESTTTSTTEESTTTSTTEESTTTSTTEESTTTSTTEEPTTTSTTEEPTTTSTTEESTTTSTTEESTTTSMTEESTTTSTTEESTTTSTTEEPTTTSTTEESTTTSTTEESTTTSTTEESTTTSTTEESTTTSTTEESTTTSTTEESTTTSTTEEPTTEETTKTTTSTTTVLPSGNGSDKGKPNGSSVGQATSEQSAGTKAQTKSALPSTGDKSDVLWSVAGLGLLLLAVPVVKRKRD
ncbi:collagen binding domain-containing protein [Streptococcus loxodontisalivarius]|uniref:LPXTG-motif cell wall-anchored protein n=1 Tax=Streptococcus loxodontisalivarius TaxID=1349415 RepID=A0ABS2PQT7_9STRE|nr:collagen binding domain-containing protein [Streptococcus loxodontisalivarius]MBM7642404.1 LPXTG-motif cell wall-anchored protein [Streptococcus loxodontisalivarius]